MKKTFLFLLSIIISSLCNGNKYEVGLFTCSPGEELYSIFGHSAIVIQDKELEETKAFNYGCFNFGIDNFYLRFASGSLEYFLGTASLQSFLHTYTYEQRGVLYNRFLLDDNQADSLVKILNDASLPENRYYKYRFITRNCATEVLNIITPFIDTPLNQEYLNATSSYTARELINESLKNHPLTKLGLALILGSKVDRKLSQRETAFIPTHLKQTLDGININGHRLLEKDSVVIEQHKTDLSKKPLFHSYGIVIALIFIGLMTTSRKIILVDYLFTSLLALIGVVIIWLMLFSEHPEVQANYNILWCNPLLPFMIPLLKRSRGLWRHFIIGFYSACALTITLLWCMGTQHYEIEFILCLIINIWLLIKHASMMKASPKTI